MLKKLKDTLLSENGMAIVNALYLIAVFTRIKFLDYIILALWLVFLIYSITHVKSKFMKVFYSILGLCVLALLIFSLYYSFLK